MKLNFSDIRDAVQKIEQSRSYFGENYDCVVLHEKYESPTCIADPDIITNQTFRIFQVEREYNGTFTVEIPECHFKSSDNMRTVKELLDAHVSIYAANKALGMGKSINKLKDWANNGAIVDDNGQPYIKSGKVIEGWKR
jgi:hypothetical protein